MTMIQCISPIDGSVYAERPAMSLEAATEAVARARKAQKGWAKRPLEERVQLVMKGVARLNEMVDEVVPELQRRGRYRTDYAQGTLRHKLFGQGDRLPAEHAGRLVQV